MKASKLVMWFWKNIATKNDAKLKSMQISPQGARVETDIAYLSDGHRHHKLDIFRPEGKQGKLPVIFDVHGGGWYYGDKELNDNYCASLVRHGFAVVDISYRLVPDTDIFGQIQDCFAALEHICTHAEEYKLDIDNLFLTGDSAGGHLVGLMTNIINDGELAQKFGVNPTVRPKAVCYTCPALNPPQMFNGMRLADKYFDPVFGKDYRKSDIKDLVSFSKYVNGRTCPSFFISAYGDFLREQTKAGYELVRSLGVDAQLCFFEKRKGEEHKLEHVFNILHWDWEESLEANARMCSFFKKYI